MDRGAGSVLSAEDREHGAVNDAIRFVWAVGVCVGLTIGLFLGYLIGKESR